ncbi:hypothetical protein ACFL0R_05595 [Pseudomonadota bacterium]
MREQAEVSQNFLDDAGVFYGCQHFDLPATVRTFFHLYIEYTPQQSLTTKCSAFALSSLGFRVIHPHRLMTQHTLDDTFKQWAEINLRRPCNCRSVDQMNEGYSGIFTI